MSDELKTSIFAPLRYPAYRALWGAAFASNVGEMMQGVAVAWIITGMTTDPGLVALVPVAAALPGVLVTLPAGVCSDLFGRRRILMLSALWSIVFSMILAFCAAMGWITPYLLLGLLFILGMGNSARLPSWQAALQDVMPRELLPSGVSLNSISFNCARSLGPALGGFLLALVGAPFVIFLNALSTSGYLWAVRQLKHPPPRMRPKWEELAQSFKQGISSLRHSSPMLWIMARFVSFNGLAACLWAFLPLIGRERLGLNSFQYGLLLTSLGMAAIIAATLVPRVRRLIPASLLQGIAASGLAIGIAWLAFCSSYFSALGAIALCGAALITSNITSNVSFQHFAPSALRGRLMSLFFFGFELASVVGALTAGAIADKIGVTATMAGCASLLLLSLPISWKIPRT